MKIINKKTISIAIILLLIIITYFAFFTRDENAVEVKTMNSYIGDIEKTVKISGIIESSDSEVINITPNLEVLKTYYKKNDYVKKGELIAELEIYDLKTSLDKASLNLEQLKRDLEDITSTSYNSEKLILVNAVEKSKTSLNTLERDLKKAKENLETSKILLESDAISQKEYETQVDVVENLQSNLINAQITYEDAQLNLSNYNSNQDNAADKLKLQIEALELDIISIKKSISERNIYANLDGIITEFNIKEGRVTNNSSTISIYNDSIYELVSLVPQEDAILIEKNQQADISLDGLEKKYLGYVLSVGKTAKIDSSSGSQTPKVEIRVIIDEPDKKIVTGYNGDAIISLEKKKDVLLIRNEAIKIDDEGKYIFIINGNSVKKTYIETNLTDGYFTSIISGIEVNQQVVLNPPEKLQDGNIITVID
ncbi:MAG: efflux RND transporter periplasmic adaptor subunit [Bacillota bacterium]|nr:efflux RND transporter periplasmic adaptor subunit [Bacillota bacterium]